MGKRNHGGAWWRNALVLLALALAIVGIARPDVTAQDPLPQAGGSWSFAGPAPITGGQVEGIPDGPVSGAVQAIVAHPTNADIVWIGSPGGGIWKTTNATSANPHWVPLTDKARSLRIASLSLDTTDPTHNTLVAGIGWTGRATDNREDAPIQLLRTTNGGTTWTPYAPALGDYQHVGVTAAVARGTTIVMVAGVMFRSVDGGATFTRVSGLPDGVWRDLVGDPSNPQVLYTISTRQNVSARGIYKSVNAGATWTKVSTSIVDAVFNGVAMTDARLAVGPAGQVFAGVLDQGQLAGLFRSGNGGTTWTQLDTPQTNEGGSPIGLHPTATVGSDSRNIFSIVADPTDPDIVYVGGARQPLAGDGMASTPNSLGASDHTGRLFRVDAALPAGMQAASLTHCQEATGGCTAVSTISNSAPHAGSRRMVFDAKGNILEGDDGGIYRRTNPRGVGDWVSVVGDLAVTEMHSVAYDRVSNAIISGNQDVGVSEQASAGATVWRQVQKGTGGSVAVEDFASATQSVRYSSRQRLQEFQRRVLDASGAVTSTAFPALTVVSGQPLTLIGPAALVQANPLAPQRLAIAVVRSNVPIVYESMDRGETLREVPRTPGNYAVSAPTGFATGGRADGTDNPDLIYLAFGYTTLIRTSPSAPLTQTFDVIEALSINDLAIDPADWRKAYLVTRTGRVFGTVDAGYDWFEITGNLAGVVGELLSAVVVPGNPAALVVGGTKGTFRMPMDATGSWQRLGTGLPNVPVRDLDYDEGDDVLVAATRGRGAWRMASVANLAAVPQPPTDVSAVAVTPASVTISWTAPSGATGYRVYRSADGVSFSLVGSTTDTTFADTTITPGTAFVYTVRAVNVAESSDSARDVATTVPFTDPVLTPTGTPIAAAHFTELLTAANAVRSLAGLPAIAFTAPQPGPTVTIRAQHLVDLRTGIAAARAALDLSPLAFTDPVITPGTTPIRAVHLSELRDAVR